MFRQACLLLAATAILAALAQPASAAVEVPFAPRFASSGRGDVAMAANTLMTCPDAGGTETQCLTARDGSATGAALNNNGYLMERVDVDSDPATFDSSRATLSLPAGATVQFAGLYYGARTSAGEGGGTAAPEAAARGTVLFQPPGAAGYSTLAASVNDSTGISAAYAGFVDVTALVAAAGPGVYGVANVQSGSGQDRYAGWSLVVAYSDPSSSPRSIHIYDGLASIVSGEPPLQIAVGGLETPPSETVNARVGIVAYEGDRGGSSGDRLSLDGQLLADAANPANNVFNSTIALEGAEVTGRTPGYNNQLGFDADILNADGILANDAAEATLAESTTLEQYLTQVVTTSIELDPVALEPPPPAPPAATPEPTPTVAPPTGDADLGKKKGGGKPDNPAPKARLDIEVEAPEQARPGAVVPYRVTVSATGSIAAHSVLVCNRLAPPLQRLAAPGAQVGGAGACWHLATLPTHQSRRFVTTAQVDADSRRRLQSTTVVRAANATSRRANTGLLVVPLPLTPCARTARLLADPVAQASC